MKASDEKLLLVLLLAAVAILGGGVAVQKLARGIRINNPGNIRRTATEWVGAVPADQRTDDEFEEFIDAPHGIRAIRKVLDSYARRGVRSLRAIISTWAPPSENPTAQLVENAARRMGINPDAEIVLARDAPALINAIIYQEQGFNPYPADVISAGLALV